MRRGMLHRGGSGAITSRVVAGSLTMEILGYRRLLLLVLPPLGSGVFAEKPARRLIHGKEAFDPNFLNGNVLRSPECCNGREEAK
jgi:hypothetical protein